MQVSVRLSQEQWLIIETALRAEYSELRENIKSNREKLAKYDELEKLSEGETSFEAVRTYGNQCIDEWQAQIDELDKILTRIVVAKVGAVHAPGINLSKNLEGFM